MKSPKIGEHWYVLFKDGVSEGIFRGSSGEGNYLVYITEIDRTILIEPFRLAAPVPLPPPKPSMTFARKIWWVVMLTTLVLTILFHLHKGLY